MKIPFLTKNSLEVEAQNLYQKALTNSDTPELPVDVENIVEFTLNYDLNLGASLPSTILGTSDWESKLVEISDSTENTGRLRFTIAHEIGHIVLHFPLLEAHYSQISLFSREDVLFQDDTSEWQANYFASALLMPSTVMVNQYGDAARNGNIIDVYEVARTFDVSKEAAQIRLETLKLVLTQPPGTPLQFNSK